MPEAGPRPQSIRPAELLELVYDELRRLARHRLANERPGHTLQPTALVHEAWLKLAASGDSRWRNREHFFAAAAEAMRRILVDHARRRAQLKRGGSPERVDLDESQFAVQVDEDKLLQVHGVIDELAAEDSLKAHIVKLRYFVGLNHDEIAEALGINERTVRRHWEVAKIRLFEFITRPTSPPHGGRAPETPPSA